MLSKKDFERLWFLCNYSIFCLDTHRNLTYLSVTFKNNDYGKRKGKLPGGI